MHLDPKDVIYILQFLVWICFGGWAMYWRSQIRDLEKDHLRTVEDMKDLKTQNAELRAKWEAQSHMMIQSYVTREDHYKFEDKVVSAIEKLGNRLDQFVGRYVIIPEPPKGQL